MKFPYELSKERISLLSPEDKQIYEFEHSGLCSDMLGLVENVGVIEEDAQIRKIMDQYLFESEFDSLFDKDIIEAVGEDEYMNIKKNLYEFIENDPEMKGELFEAPGHAADWWMDFKVGWIGKLAAGLLTGLLGLVAWLIMKGKDRLAMVKLKQYMNKLVELIDMGVNKKRPWYSFLMLSKKKRQNTGDYNKACFRTIQETAERNMACLYTQCIHNLGFLNPGITDFRGITSGMPPQDGSGLFDYSLIIHGNVKNLNAIDDINASSDNNSTQDNYIKLLPVQPDLTKFNSLKLPALPTNYTMLMCNIEYPAKADKNPNGSLFMKPTQEILQAKAEDLGLVYFSGLVNENESCVNEIIHWTDEKKTQPTTQKPANDSFDYALKNPYIQMLLEADEENKTDQSTRAGRGIDGINIDSVMTDDTTDEILSAEIKTHTEGKRTTVLKQFEGNIIDAIDGYMRSSIPVVQKLIRAICGQEAFKNSGGFEAMIAQLINAGEGQMLDWLKKEDSVISKISKNFQEEGIQRTTKYLNVLRRIRKLETLLRENKDFKDFLTGFGKDTKNKFYEILDKIADKMDKYSDPVKQLDDELIELIGCNYVQISRKYVKKDDDEDDETNEFTFESLIYNPIYENEVQLDDKEIIDSLEKNLDISYNRIRNYLSEQLGSAINSDPAKWQIITDSKARMDKLKEAADKEINAKIELICRLAGEGKTDIGDKFKSAISKHPLRAEGLKRIWAMYSDDLQDRIETRIRSITGDNGNSNILTTIKQFLINVYPNLMAIMLYYKQLFFLIENWTKRYPLNAGIKEAALKQMQELEKEESMRNLGKNIPEDESNSSTPDSSVPDSSTPDSSVPTTPQENIDSAIDGIPKN